MFKKSLVICSALTLLHLPVIANANLITINNTNEDSSVKISSGSLHPCSSAVPVFGTYTPAHGTSNVSDAGVRAICFGSGSNCSADVYMTKDCSGPITAHAILDLSNMTIASIDIINSKYKLIGNGSNLKIDYA